jgi:hypothetical protein
MSNKLTKSLDEIIQSNRQNQKAITVVKKEGGANQTSKQGGERRVRKNWNRKKNLNDRRQTLQRRNQKQINRDIPKVCKIILKNH